MEKPAIPTVAIFLFPLLFAALWCGMSLLLATVGGWRRLANAFPAPGPPVGSVHYLQGGRVGMVTYKGCLIIHCSPRGLRLSVLLPFRLGHPPFFVPWEAVQEARVHRFLWAESVTFEVGSPSVATLELSKRLFEGQSLVR